MLPRTCSSENWSSGIGKPSQVDFLEAGSGETVILIHSSVAGARQWRSLMDLLAPNYHLIAINLFGYGTTPPWNSKGQQTLEDQARLVAPFAAADGSKFSIVGHSFDGAVAMKAAAMFRNQVHRLVLVEPNPFYLLRLLGCVEAFREATALRDVIKDCGARDDWRTAAEVFANYWAGAGSWNAMPDDRREKFTAALVPNFHEWDCVMHEETPISTWAKDLPDATTVISADDTVGAIAETVRLFREHMPHWRFENVSQGGHMAAITKPDLINPVIQSALL
ncbi:alpha/beta fold hydrolase [Ovoidimarina sediminis]|uniref:alpha/beta fold hydrolase n=1 Tax=Ovoidimarina sediminis TaxID=3079856 RepID=UPI0029123BBF|nr:alpha/beta hydrolase [Rhodophyticola sp. MJ-SS7]MDU8946478.1 alpha/beta hydrolase [Rhodophyticola sp. MJ-SS7]